MPRVVHGAPDDGVRSGARHPAQRRVGELTAIPANALSEISSTHMKGSYMYANELANALAGANRDGEEARREERLRIWGYA